MDFRCGLRSQYFLRLLKEKVSQIAEKLQKNSISAKNAVAISESIGTQFADYLDQAILPTIALEVHNAKQNGVLVGETPQERYQSFFVQNNSWTIQAKAVIQKYPFLFDLIKIYLDSACENVLICIERLHNDYTELESKVLSGVNSELTELKILGSDRHRGGKQALLLQFGHESLVYKPVDLGAEEVFSRYVEMLELPYPYDLQTVNVLNKKEYGWVEFIAHREVKSLTEVSAFYRRAGVLLAVSDSLNYSDGHFENLIACGEYPILIDCETLFQVFGILVSEGISVERERSILMTGLVQKAPEEEDGRGFTAAFQTPVKERFEFFHTHAINEGTDSLEVRFQGVVDEESQNCPTLCGEFQTPVNFVDEFIDGYRFGYAQIMEKRAVIASANGWWEGVRAVKFRQLIRTTLYYQLLIRKIQQPEQCVSTDSSSNCILPLLSDGEDLRSVFAEYELGDLLQLDVPYFHHSITETGVYDANGMYYPDYFSNSAEGEVKANLMAWCLEHMQRNMLVLKNALAQSPEPGKPVFRTSP